MNCSGAHNQPPISLQFRPVPLWSWNDRMEPGTCADMIRQLKIGGFGGAYLHARLGMDIDFMSQSYLEAVKASVSAAKKIGVHAHLYDEDRWPSGWAGGAVPLANPSHRLKSLVRRKIDEADEGASRSIAEIDGYRYSVKTMPLGHPKFNGTCYTDLTDPEGMKCFLDRAYEPLQDCLGEDLWSATPTIFTDEPALTYLYSWPEGALPWSEKLPERFSAATGQSIVDSLPALFEGRPDAGWIRYWYYRNLAELFAESFMRQISSWCRKHEIRWTGHFMYEHSLPLHFSWSANCHGLYRYFDWPGVDHLGRQVGEVVTAIGCRSAVHQFDKERMMTELFGASGQHLSFADRKWIGEQQIVLGANHLVPHLVSTTLRGPRKRDYPPTLSPHQPWWPENSVVEDHLARLCEIMAGGSPLTDLLIVHPQESVFVMSHGPVEVGKADTWEGRFFHPAVNAELQQLDVEWKQLCHQLLDVGYVFDFGDEGVLSECGDCERRYGEPMLRVGAASYRAVLLPPIATIRTSTAKLLLEFARSGGVLVQLGDGPRMLDGNDDAESQQELEELSQNVVQQFATVAEFRDWLLTKCPPEIRIEDGSPRSGRIWQYSKSDGKIRKTFLVNLDRLHERQVKIHWRTAPRETVTVWNTHSLSSSQVNVVDAELSLALPPGGSCILIEGERPALVPPLADVIPKSRQARVIDFDALDWIVTRLDDNALVVDNTRFRLPGREWQGPFPALAIKEWLDARQYVGPLEIRYEFATRFPSESAMRLRLVVEGIESVARLRLNGQLIDTRTTRQATWLDRHWHPIGLPSELLVDHNCVEVSLDEFHFADPASRSATRRTGTEVESLMVLGDFAVDGQEARGRQGWAGQIEYHTNTPLADWLPPQPLRHFTAPFELSPARRLSVGDVTLQGLPFYAGRLRYEAELDTSGERDRPLRLRIESLNAPVAVVEVDGQRVGCFCWPPYEVDLPTSRDKGSTRIAITLYHSLRNLLGPHHHPVGEPVYVTPGSFRPEGCAEWLESLRAGRPLPAWTNAYSLVEFGLGSTAAYAESDKTALPST